MADAIASYLKSGHTGRYADVIARSNERGAHAELVKFLLMVRKKIREPKVCCPCKRVASSLHFVPA